MRKSQYTTIPESYYLLFSIDFKIISLLTVFFILEIESWTLDVEVFTLCIKVFGCTFHVALISESKTTNSGTKNI